MRHPHSLTALRVFEAAARSGSFADAARELNVTRPAVSKQIRLLEQTLGCRLLDRSASGCTPTREGRELFNGLNQAFDLIAATFERVADKARHERKIRILVERDFASSWLAQRIGTFLIGNPGIAVEIVAERNGRLNLNENYSFRIFYGKEGCFEGGDLVAEALCNWVDLPVCTSDYAADHVTPRGRLRDAHFLLDGNYNPWRQWFAVSGVEDPGDLATYTTFNETTLCLSAAIAGSGITIGDSFLSMSALEAGELIAPFRTGMRSVEIYSMYRPKGVRLTPTEQVFRDWLLKTIKEYDVEVEAKLSAFDIAVMEN